MASPFPTRYELKWSGWSLVIAQLLWVWLGVLYAVLSPQTYENSVYTVTTEAEVVALHEKLSSNNMRVYIEAIAAIYWLTFPMLLVAIYGIRKIYLSLFVGTPMEMWVYVLEKGYLLSLLVTNIIGPAICLVIVSFDWRIDEDTDDVPSGYYIQLYALLVVEELYDAVCIADGLFLFLICIIPQFRYCARDEKFKVMRHHGRARTLLHIFVFLMAVSVAIAYLVSLFRFAESGFFSLNGGAAWLVIYGFLIKFFVGFRMLRIGYGACGSTRYDDLQRVFDVKKTDSSSLAAAGGGSYNMDSVAVEMPRTQQTGNE